MLKKLKKRMAIVIVACTLAVCGGFAFLAPITAFAESAEMVENEAKGEGISDNIEASEKIPDASETGENSDGSEEDEKNTDAADIESMGDDAGEGNTITKDEVTALVKDAYNKSKEWVKNTYAWIIGIGGGGIITILLSVFWKLISAKISHDNSLTEDKVSEISLKSSEDTVRKIVGKSLNVDIRSEVGESVKAELSPMIRNSELAMQSAKNAEVGTALVLKAVAKSRLISEDETKTMESMAASLLAHAEKYGGLSAPICIQAEYGGDENDAEKTETKDTESLVETPNKPTGKDNESYINF